MINVAGDDHPLNKCRACGGMLAVWEYSDVVHLWRVRCDKCEAVSPITTCPASAVRWYLFLTRKLKGEQNE
jgi:hypothetical protein